MSGIVQILNLCLIWAPEVKPGWRGPWPCDGEKVLRRGDGEPIGVIECPCPCHRGIITHPLPKFSDRTAVHPTDVLADG